MESAGQQVVPQPMASMSVGWWWCGVWGMKVKLNKLTLWYGGDMVFAYQVDGMERVELQWYCGAAQNADEFSRVVGALVLADLAGLRPPKEEPSTSTIPGRPVFLTETNETEK